MKESKYRMKIYTQKKDSHYKWYAVDINRKKKRRRKTERLTKHTDRRTRSWVEIRLKHRQYSTYYLTMKESHLAKTNQGVCEDEKCIFHSWIATHEIYTFHFTHIH